MACQWPSAWPLAAGAAAASESGLARTSPPCLSHGGAQPPLPVTVAACHCPRQHSSGKYQLEKELELDAFIHRITRARHGSARAAAAGRDGRDSEEPPSHDVAQPALSQPQCQLASLSASESSHFKFQTETVATRKGIGGIKKQWRNGELEPSPTRPKSQTAVLVSSHH